MSIEYDPDTKRVTALDPSDTQLVEEVEALNRLMSDLQSTKAEVPESPQPNKALAPLIQKMATTGVEAMKKKDFAKAETQFTLAIDMASRRTRWEAFGVQLQELTNLIQARCDSYVMQKKFPEAHADADLLLQMQVNSPENFLRRAIPLINLGRFEEARADIDKGLAFHPDHPGLKQHKMVVQAMILEENGDVTVKFQNGPAPVQAQAQK